MEQSVIVTWTDSDRNTEVAQARMNELGKEGYRIKFFQKAGAEYNYRNTVILVREVEAGKENL